MIELIFFVLLIIAILKKEIFMNTRITKVYKYMEQHSLDLVMITLPRSIYYLTGFNTNPHERFFCLYIPLKGEPGLIIPELDLEDAKAKSSVTILHTHKDDENPMNILKRLNFGKIKRCGVEASYMTLKWFEDISTAIDIEKYIDIEEPLQNMKMIKTDNELDMIRHSIDIAERALSEGLKVVKEGIKERDLAAEIEYQRKKFGADAGGLMIVSGEKSALPHGRTGDRELRNGDLLLTDGGVIKNGYVSDISRTFGIGELDDKKREIYNTVLQANKAAIDAIKPGVTFGRLDEIAREVIAEKGYDQYFTHRLGHGMGTHNHEYPSIHGENKDIVLPGMVFTIEPGIYVPGIGGVRIEDDVVATEEGVEVLTTFEKELMIL